LLKIQEVYRNTASQNEPRLNRLVNRVATVLTAYEVWSAVAMRYTYFGLVGLGLVGRHHSSNSNRAVV
jgi:hypothetical protein